jgi:predicted HTH transcriptional regulator
MMVELNDEELLLRLKNFEDNFVERKTSGDSKDWLKTVVAFANSTPVGYPAVLYVGVKNDGTPEEKPVNLDSLQKTFTDKLSDAYPPVYYLTKIVNVEGQQVLAVIVPGSADRPHFAGQAYVREGSKSSVASKLQFEELIASRNSKVYEILKWKGKLVTLDLMNVPTALHATGAVISSQAYSVAECNQFYLTLDAGTFKRSVPLDRVNISFDQNAQRLKLEERQL